MIKGIINFIQASFGFNVPPREAIRHFESKGLKPSFSYLDVTAEEHRTAFTVAKMMDMDLLQDMQDGIRQAIKQGWTYEQWADRIIPHLQANGWWGRQAVLDPLTGKTVVAELGSARRLQIIFRTNMQMAYSVGRWEQIMRQAEDAPYLMYDAVDDFRTRPKHRAWDNTILPISHVFWQTHAPPNGFNCRCNLIQFSKSELEALGLSVTDSPKVKLVDWTNPRTGQRERIPDGVDAGFAYNAGQARVDELQRLAREKAVAIEDQALREAAQEGLVALEVAQKNQVVLATPKYQSGNVNKQHFDQPPSETFSIYDIGAPKVTPDTSSPLKKNVVEFEDGIRNDDLETAGAFDSNGVLLFKRQGEPDRVDLSKEEVLLLPKNIFTHNHPRGTTLSLTDINRAVEYDIGEIRVVTPLIRYRVTTKVGAAWPSVIALVAAFEDAKAKANRIVNELVRSGDLNPQFAEAEYLHYIWVVACGNLGLIYERERS
jgi:SPP1 gp7 family putative phage head morphogenesis protein